MPVDVVARATPALRTFVRDTLGCTCPETVFDAVARGDRSLAGGASYVRLVIGNRLLVYVIVADVGPHRIAGLAAAGLRDRDACGLNRFRLVIGLPPGTANAGALEGAFAAAVAGDPKAHLHCVPEADCEAVASPGRTGSPG